ncbi:MAG: serine/threonine-protein kinase [Chloroflexota bacterium]
MAAASPNRSQLDNIADRAPTHLLVPNKFALPVSFAWVVITVVSIGFFILGLPHRFQDLLSVAPDVQHGLDLANVPNLGWALGMLIPEVLMMLVYTIIGISLFIQKSKDINILVVSMLLVSWGTTIMNVVEAFAADFPFVDGWILFSRALSWSLIMTILLIFPNGRLYPKWSKWLLIFWYGWIWSWFFFPELPHNISIHGGLADPIRFLIYFSLLGIGVAAQVRRYHRVASPTERQQAKWAFLGIALMFLITFLEEAPSALDPTLVDQTTPESILYALVSTFFFVIGSLAFPIGIAASIQRKRLWQIDYVINRGLGFTLLTIVLGLAFFALFTFLEALFYALLDNQYSAVVAITSGLVTISLFRPTRGWLQNFVDNRIYKIQIDYWEKKKLLPSYGFQLLQKLNKVGDYEITEMIARGGMAEIFKGKHVATGKEAAVKILLPHFAQDQLAQKRFIHEAQTISQLEHDNIVKLFDYGETDDLIYMIMEFISYQSLANQIKTEAPLSLKYTHQIITQIACALDYIHQQGTIHRDIKPSNILLRPAQSKDHPPQAVLTDFGIAKTSTQSEQLRNQGFIGSLDYISPEQIQAAVNLDQRADIYSLGVMTFQMLAGNLPFQTKNRAATLIAHIQQPVPNILAYNPGLPDKVAFSIVKAMSKNPTDRFDRASDFAEALKI